MNHPRLVRSVLLAWTTCLAAAPCLTPPASSLVAAPAPRTAESTPSFAEIKQLYDDAKYKDVIRAVARVTASHEWQAKKPDGYALLMMKAESHLRLKETALAASTFETAAKLSPDQASGGLARATAALIKRSIGQHYVPRATMNKHAAGHKSDDHPTIDIVDLESRKAALEALYKDEKDAAAPKLSPATSTENKSMQAVLEGAPLAGHLRDFDYAVHGNDDETRELASNIATHGRDLLTEMIDKMAIRVDVIASKALAIDQYKIQIPSGRGYSSQDRWRKHGLENMEPKELQDMIEKTAKIQKAVTILGDSLSTESDFFKQVTTETKRIGDKADKTLKTDFSEVYMSRKEANG